MTNERQAFAGAVLASLLLDQGTKGWIERAVPTGARIPGIDGFFYVTHARNPDGSFGLFAGSPLPLRHVMLVGLPLVAVGLVAYFYHHLAPRERRPAFALGMILGGIVGNLVDRVARGEVVDFLRVHLSPGYAWPDFNLADLAIVVGLGVLVLDVVAVRRSRPG